MKTKHRNQAATKRLFRTQYQRDPGAIGRVFLGVRQIEPRQAAEIEMPIRLAFEDMRNGNGSDADFYALVSAINIAAARSHSISPECVAVCDAAMQGMQRAQDRHARIGRWGFDGPALADIAACLDLFSQVVGMSTCGQILDSIQRVARGVRSGNLVVSELAA